MPDHPIVRISPPGHYVEIDGDALYLGRDCHLATFIPALLNKVVSNRHCAIRRETGGRWMLEDLGSTNGTWSRGTRLFGKVLLHTGDLFSLGKNGPTCECHSGFGGTGPDATVPEDERAARRPSAVDPAAATAIMDDRDGTIDRPYRVGRAPEVRLRHERTGQVFQATGYTLVLGRDPSAAQIVIRSDAEKHVSGRHAEIRFRTDGVPVVRDLGSRNGTTLNGRALAGEMPLRAGDRVVLGAPETTLLVVALSADLGLGSTTAGTG
jgi:ABC transport system ATP-binding/permease protein